MNKSKNDKKKAQNRKVTLGVGISLGIIFTILTFLMGVGYWAVQEGDPDRPSEFTLVAFAILAVYFIGVAVKDSWWTWFGK